MNLDDLKRQAQQAKQTKKAKKEASNASNLQPSDILFVLHSDEVDTLEDVLLDVLIHWDDSLSNKEKHNILDILKYIQEDEEI